MEYGRSRVLAMVASFAMAAALVVAVQTRAEAAGFVDVPGGSYYEDAVDWLVDQGITSGTSPTTFSPDDPTLRAQMAAFLWRFGFEYEGAAHTFVDVPGGSYYDEAVGWLLLHRITTGTSPSTYGPTLEVTRAQMAVFLWRFAGEPEPFGPHPFTDVPANAWYEKAVAWLVERGITSGTSPTTYSPDAVVTRAQMATFLWRFAGRPMVGDSASFERNPRLFDCSLQSSIPESECEALVELDRVNGGILNNPGWIVEPDPADWTGVTVSGGVVTELVVAGAFIFTVPPEIGNLVNLTLLSFFSNQISSLPPEIGDLANLTSLFLNGNDLTTLPPEIGDLANLEYLMLSANQIASLPDELWTLTGLLELDLYGNQLASIPADIDGLTSLEWLYLGVNQLTSLPPEVGNLSNLKGLLLNHNQLSTLPATVANLSNLRDLLLNSNQFVSLPDAVWSLANLELLYADDNGLASLSADVDNLTLLHTLHLQDNNLTSLPIELMNLTNLNQLNLYGQASCITVGDPGFEAWLDTESPSWDQCP